MVETLRPENAGQLRDALRWAAAEEQPLAVAGTGSKAALGRPTNVSARLELTGLSGITNYEPEELVLTAGAGTPIAEVREALDEHDQVLGFDPPDYRAVLGGRGSGTLGGVIATNLSGPGRIKVGAARDHLLGFSGVSGRGETFLLSMGCGVARTPTSGAGGGAGELLFVVEGERAIGDR